MQSNKKQNGIGKKQSTSGVACIQQKQRVLIAALSDYSMTLEDKLEDLHHFRVWAAPKMTEGKIEVSRLKEEMNNSHARVNYLEDTAHVPSLLNSEEEAAAVLGSVACEPSSPITPSMDRRNKTTAVMLKKTVNALKEKGEEQEILR